VADITFDLDGEDAFKRAMAAKGEAIVAAATRAVGDSISAVHRTMVELLRVYSHPMGTPTPSPPGHPPALVTGSLIRSIHERGPQVLGPIITGSVGPTIVYARIQELGGHAGRGHRSYLPPRPYVKPTVAIEGPRAYQRLVSAVARAVAA